MRRLWHRLMVRLGFHMERPFTLTNEMIANEALMHLDNNLVLKRLRGRSNG